MEGKGGISTPAPARGSSASSSDDKNTELERIRQEMAAAQAAEYDDKRQQFRRPQQNRGSERRAIGKLSFLAGVGQVLDLGGTMVASKAALPKQKGSLAADARKIGDDMWRVMGRADRALANR